MINFDEVEAQSLSAELLATIEDTGISVQDAIAALVLTINALASDASAPREDVLNWAANLLE